MRPLSWRCSRSVSFRWLIADTLGELPSSKTRCVRSPEPPDGSSDHDQAGESDDEDESLVPRRQPTQPLPRPNHHARVSSAEHARLRPVIWRSIEVPRAPLARCAAWTREDSLNREGSGSWQDGGRMIRRPPPIRKDSERPGQPDATATRGILSVTVPTVVSVSEPAAIDDAVLLPRAESAVIAAIS
jgi:hypothetical protein